MKFFHIHTYVINEGQRDRMDEIGTAAMTLLRKLNVFSEETYNYQVLHAPLRDFKDVAEKHVIRDWSNIRAWWSLYWGNPDKDGKKLFGLHIQWVFKKRDTSLGLSMTYGAGDANTDISFAFLVPFFAFFFVLEDVLPNWAVPGRPYTRQNGTIGSLPEERELGFRVMDNSIFLYLWSTDEWDSGKPFWDARSTWRKPVLHPVDWLFGKVKYTQEPLFQTEASVILPEGEYPIQLEVKKKAWKRPHWFSSKLIYAAEATPAKPLPVPGKGENGWDCEEDAIYSMSFGFSDEAMKTMNQSQLVVEAVRHVQESVLETRRRYGGENWRPAVRA